LEGKIDYQKLLEYLKKKYGVEKTFYFGGVEIHDFNYNYLDGNSVPIEKVKKHLIDLIKNKTDKFNEVQ
jgi:hypothetical protein